MERNDVFMILVLDIVSKYFIASIKMKSISPPMGTSWPSATSYVAKRFILLDALSFYCGAGVSPACFGAGETFARFGQAKLLRVSGRRDACTTIICSVHRNATISSRTNIP
jgi:hypothetical protein